MTELAVLCYNPDDSNDMEVEGKGDPVLKGEHRQNLNRLLAAMQGM